MLQVAPGSRPGRVLLVRAPNALLVAFVSLLVVGQVVADAPQNDAGLGFDAGDTRATATPLPSGGAFAGELRSQDNDWFTLLRAPGPACVSLDVSGDTYADATLALRSGSVDHRVTVPILQGVTTRLALAGSSVSQSWDGFERKVNPAGNDPARPRYYQFAVAESGTGGMGDANSGRDAGSMLSSAVPLTTPCSSGRLNPLQGFGDTSDLFSFTLTETTQIVYSLGATAPGVALRVVDISGAAAGPAVSGDGLATVTLPAGNYAMSATAVEGTAVIDYVIALVGGGPGNPCRPACALGT